MLLQRATLLACDGGYRPHKRFSASLVERLEVPQLRRT